MLSFILCTAGLLYFGVFIVQDGCLAAGGSWLGATKGCEGGNEYSPSYLTTPFAIVIFIGVDLGVSSALIQIHSLFTNQKR